MEELGLLPFVGTDSIREYTRRCLKLADSLSLCDLYAMGDSVVGILEVLPTAHDNGNYYSEDLILFVENHKEEITRALDKEGMVREAKFLHEAGFGKLPLNHFGLSYSLGFRGILPVDPGGDDIARPWSEVKKYAVQQLAFGRAIFNSHQCKSEASAHKKKVVATYAKLKFLSDSEVHIASVNGPSGMKLLAREFEAALVEAEVNFAPWRAHHRNNGVELRSGTILKKLSDLKAI